MTISVILHSTLLSFCQIFVTITIVALKIVIVTTNCLLVFQFLLGMIVNLFFTIPFDQIDVTSGSFVEKTGLAFGYARTSPILALQLH